MEFQTDWFTHNIPTWSHVLAPFRGKPDLRFLEIGSFEGRSACWLLTEILTHPTAHLTCIDPFTGNQEHLVHDTWRQALPGLQARFLANIAATGTPEKVTTLSETSATALHRLQGQNFHCAYIDGSHKAADVLHDMLGCWNLLCDEGVLICDDYEWHVFEDPAELPRTAIDAFLRTHATQYEVLHKGYQVILRKLPT